MPDCVLPASLHVDRRDDDTSEENEEGHDEEPHRERAEGAVEHREHEQRKPGEHVGGEGEEARELGLLASWHEEEEARVLQAVVLPELRSFSGVHGFHS